MTRRSFLFTKFTLLAGCITALHLSSFALAHHSAAMFDPVKVTTLTGTVRVFQWANPHCYIQLLVRNARGMDEEWNIEMGAPQHLIKNGWKKTTLKRGDRITATLHPLRDGGKGGEVVTVTTADGKSLGNRK